MDVKPLATELKLQHSSKFNSPFNNHSFHADFALVRNKMFHVEQLIGSSNTITRAPS